MRLAHVRQGTSLALIGAYVLAGELAATSGDRLRAFAEYENSMRPFVEANQALGLRSSKIMLSGKNKSVSGWLLKQFMRIMPGPVLEWIINRSTERIRKGQRNFPERLSVLLEIKRSVGGMTGFAIQSTRALLSFPTFVNSRVVIAANTHIARSLLKRESSA